MSAAITMAGLVLMFMVEGSRRVGTSTHWINVYLFRS